MQSFKDNFFKLYRHYSTYVAFFASGAAAYWLQMSLEEQTALLSAAPALKVLAPIVSFGAFLVARGVPQQPEAAK